MNARSYVPHYATNPMIGLMCGTKQPRNRLAKELLITEGALEKCQGELNLAFDRMQDN
jgi:hypothetical protein